MAMIRQALLTYRKVIGVGIIAFVSDLGYSTLSQSAIPPYVELLGLAKYIGTIYAVFVIAETLLKTPMGSLEDRVGLRAVYVAAAVIGATAALIWTRMTALWMIIIVRVIDGAGSASIWTATILAMSEVLESRSRTTAMSIYLATYLGGLSLGPLVGGYANDVTHSRLTAFYVAGSLFILTAILAAHLLPGAHHRVRERNEPPSPQHRSFFEQMRQGFLIAPAYMVIAFIIFAAFGLIIPIIKLFAMLQLGMSETTYGLVVLPVVSVLTLISLGSGTLAAFWGKTRSITVGLAISALAMYSVPLVHHYLGFALVAGAVGLGFVIGMPAWLALVIDMTPVDMRGTVIGALGTWQGIGVILGAAASSFLFKLVPIHLLGIHLPATYTPFVISAVLLTIGFFVVLAYVREGNRGELSGSR